MGHSQIKSSFLLFQDNPENKYAVGMSIGELKAEDSGNYYCKGNNSHGDETQHFQLVVVEASHKVLVKYARAFINDVGLESAGKLRALAPLDFQI